MKSISKSNDPRGEWSSQPNLEKKKNDHGRRQGPSDGEEPSSRIPVLEEGQAEQKGGERKPQELQEKSIGEKGQHNDTDRRFMLGPNGFPLFFAVGPRNQEQGEGKTSQQNRQGQRKKPGPHVFQGSLGVPTGLEANGDR